MSIFMRLVYIHFITLRAIVTLAEHGAEYCFSGVRPTSIRVCGHTSVCVCVCVCVCVSAKKSYQKLSTTRFMCYDEP